jgi:hypothetical protein
MDAQILGIDVPAQAAVALKRLVQVIDDPNARARTGLDAVQEASALAEGVDRRAADDTRPSERNNRCASIGGRNARRKSKLKSGLWRSPLFRRRAATVTFGKRTVGLMRHRSIVRLRLSPFNAPAAASKTLGDEINPPLAFLGEHPVLHRSRRAILRRLFPRHGGWRRHLRASLLSCR